ncbi:Transcription initiation factor TFIID, subunit TAF10 [Pseudoloma neurophilia]|uniref:Transcription initiation factor TFIID, subunit TAF10 n=1 Tax=Pseudoloma neurophilia TaxID=146866 RepID=A0A0R0M341_9MICR|nr:Transcription initiation factor TFIID, subunit TAF10 [Pseudoloma neurophilia]
MSNSDGSDNSDLSYEQEIEMEIAEDSLEQEQKNVDNLIEAEQLKTVDDEKVDLNNFKPLIPDLVLDYLLETNGIDCADEETRKVIAALGQKFIADIAQSAYQFHKIHQKAIIKDKRFLKEKKTTLTVSDLTKALQEYGIDISRPAYFT